MNAQVNNMEEAVANKAMVAFNATCTVEGCNSERASNVVLGQTVYTSYNCTAHEADKVIAGIKAKANAEDTTTGTVAEKATTILSRMLGAITSAWASVKTLDKKAVINNAWASTKQAARTVWSVASMFLDTRAGKVVSYTATASTALLVGGLVSTGVAGAVVLGTVLTAGYYMVKDIIINKDDRSNTTSAWKHWGKALLATTLLAALLWVAAPVAITGLYYTALSVLVNFVIIFG